MEPKQYLKIIFPPRLTTYYSNTVPNLFGFLCGLFDENDKLIDFYSDPWIEYPEFSKPGVYKAKVYLDKEHTNNIFDTFKYRIVEYEE